MADTDVDTDLNTAPGRSQNNTEVINGNEKWAFYLDAANDLNFNHTNDLNASTPTWDGPTAVSLGASPLDASNSQVQFFQIWYDKWTKGDTGDLIHMAWLDSGDNVAYYRNMDTGNADALSTAIDLNAEMTLGMTSVVANGVRDTNLSITKATGGRIYIAFSAVPTIASEEHRFVRAVSPYTTTNWTNVTATDTFHKDTGSSFSQDRVILMPAPNDAADDIYGITLRVDDNVVTVWHWDQSAAAGAGTLTLVHTPAGGANVERAESFQTAAVPDINNGHVYIGCWSLFDNAAADVHFYDMTSAATIGGDDLPIENLAESGYVKLTHDPTNDRVYLFYTDGTTGAASAFGTDDLGAYQTSDDNGGSWSGRQALTVDDADGVAALGGPAVLNFAGEGATLSPLWHELVDDDLMENNTNKITIAGIAVVSRLRQLRGVGA